MKRNTLIFVLFAAISIGVIGNVAMLHGWGFWAHERINRYAVFTLPDELKSFYKQHIGFLTKESTAPDRRRNADKSEAPRHYVDIDHFAPAGSNPFDQMPKVWQDAVQKYSKDTLLAYGTVPWQIDAVMQRLTAAFKAQNVDSIVFLSAELGHYVGDAFVPLHTTENYDGQFTNQRGLHSFWESRLPELYGAKYNPYCGAAEYLPDPLNTAWNILKASNAALDSVLRFDRELNAQFPEKEKYVLEKRGDRTFPVYSEPYALRYNAMLAGMVERRFRESIRAVGSFWFTAWVNAGKPDMRAFASTLTDSTQTQKLADEEISWKQGVMLYGGK